MKPELRRAHRLPRIEVHAAVRSSSCSIADCSSHRMLLIVVGLRRLQLRQRHPSHTDYATRSSAQQLHLVHNLQRLPLQLDGHSIRRSSLSSLELKLPRLHHSPVQLLLASTEDIAMQR